MMKGSAESYTGWFEWITGGDADCDEEYSFGEGG